MASIVHLLPNSAGARPPNDDCGRVDPERDLAPGFEFNSASSVRSLATFRIFKMTPRSTSQRSAA